MQRWIRIGTALVGVLFLVQALAWMVDPAQAAEALGMPLLDGVGRSSQVGDTAAFFLGLGVLPLLGAYTRERQWIQGAALLLGAAALMRLLAWAAHDAAFATDFIAVELVLCGALLYSARRLEPEG